MRRPKFKRLARWFAAGLTLVLVVGLFLYVWGVGAIIRVVVRQQYGGHAVVGDWWINGTSAGINGVRLGESADPTSPTWLESGRITTDVSLRSLLHGRYLPTRITVDQPRLALKFTKDGQLTTKLPFRASSTTKPSAGGKASSIPLPEIVLKDAEATIAQDGRPPLVIHRTEAKMIADGGKERIEATTDDPVWGRLTVAGEFSPTFRDGSVTIQTGPNFSGTMEMARSIPFIPAEVWDNVRASGPLDATVNLRVALDSPEPVHATTHLKLNGASATVVPLQVDTTHATGDVTIDGAEVVVDLRGKAIDGTFRAAGRLDFAQNPPAVALNLRLRGIDVQRTPAAWQLGELGATGTLTARVDLRARLGQSIDLKGTMGHAVIDNGSLQGIPIQNVAVDIKAEGDDLQFSTNATDKPVDRVALESAPTVPTPDALPKPGPMPAGPSSGSAASKAAHPFGKLLEPALGALPLIRLATRDEGIWGWTTFAISEIVEFRTSRGLSRPGQRLRLPKTISTQLELKDVDLRDLLAKVEKYGIRVKFPVSGRLSVKATATIPLATFTDLKAYTIHGDASLSQTSINHFDLGNLEAHLDVENGVVDLSDFRGVIVDRPNQDLAENASAPPAPPREGELPDGGFRGGVHAQIAPLGRASARFEAKRLPLGELFAPVLPHPTPLSGDLSTHLQADVNLAQYRDPRAYTIHAGSFESRRVAYRGALLDRVASRFALADGKFTLEEFSARLAGKPLNLKGDLTLGPPYRFEVAGHVDGWEIADVLRFVPTLPHDAGFGGRIDAHADASGTAFPFSLQTRGGIRALDLRLGSVPVRSVVGEWRTERGEVVVSGLEAAIFDGKMTGDARIPTSLTGLKPLDLNLGIKGVDARAITALLPDKAPSLEGLADGRVSVRMPLDASTIDATVNLNAPDLRFRPEGRYGPAIRVEALRIAAQAHDRLIRYETTAQTLGARILFTGSMPLDKDPGRSIANAEARVVGFRLGEAWRSLGLGGGIAQLDGEGAIDANLRATVQPPRLWSRGLFELRGLRYGPHLPIGDIRGQASYSPAEWKLEGLAGTLFGGVASGDAFGLVQNNRLGESTFRFRVDRASVAKLLAGVPALAKGAEGFGSIRATGRLDQALTMALDISIPHAKLLNLAVSDVRMPAEVNLSPASGVGALHARRWTGRLAGGSIEGNALARLGTDRSFRSDIKLTNVDLAVLSRLGAVPSQASEGKLTGTIRLEGPDPTNLGKVRGGFNFDLDDATLVAIPALKGIERFLGSAGNGGLFEDGDMSGRIANETIYLEQLTLNGQLAQVHVLGSITFKGGLNLEVLANTNQIIPRTGLAILDALPRQLGAFLSGRLLKFRVTGTAQNPVVALDPTITVGDTAAGFFAGALRGSR